MQRSPRLYLGNAFSLSMLPLGVGESASIKVERISSADFVATIKAAHEEGRLDCAIGHPSTAAIVGRLTGIDPEKLGCKRRQITLQPGDALLVIQLTFRPPEGKIYTMEELEELLRSGKIAYYLVRYA